MRATGYEWHQTLRVRFVWGSFPFIQFSGAYPSLWLIWFTRSSHLHVEVDQSLVQLAPIIFPGITISLSAHDGIQLDYEKNRTGGKSRITTATTVGEDLSVQERKERDSVGSTGIRDQELR